MSKEEIVSAIQSCAQTLGRVPTRRELQRMNGISYREVDRRFGSYGRAVLLAGLEPERKHTYGIPREVLLEDWGRIARKLGKAPTRFEYIAEGGYSSTPFERRWKRWPQVAEDFVRFAKEAGREGTWEDVLGITGIAQVAGIEIQTSPPMSADGGISRALTRTRTNGRLSNEGGADHLSRMEADGKVAVTSTATAAGIGIEEQPSPQIDGNGPDQKLAGRKDYISPLMNAESADLLRSVQEEMPEAFSEIGRAGKNGPLWRKRKVLRDRPVYGAPAMHAGALGHVPTTEAGVLVAFGMIAAELGLVVLRVQTEFPDCEVLCEMEPGRWQRLRVEFEFESRNFLRHHHDANGCDMIVCWVHNWAECPENIEVVELSKLMAF